jgi:hypothetical protein
MDDTRTTEGMMFRTVRRKIRGMILRGTTRLRGGDAPRNDDAYLRSSKANEARLNAAIDELNAGRGTLTTRAHLRDAPRR